MVSELPPRNIVSEISNSPEFSVSELSAALKRTVEGAFGYVRVRGEIFQPKVAGSGHCYLRLKDENAVLDGVIWRGTMAKLSFAPEEGLEVLVWGRLTIYPGRSTYQIVVESLELAGEGALLKLLDERREKLHAEGLFEEKRKQQLPYLPETIGVVTSPTGSVIRDIIHRIKDRFPCRVLVWPVRVQGKGAAEEVAAAIEGFNDLSDGGTIPRPELLIVARGGGSLEDLWAFNEEIVVRAVAASDIPLISAIGHEVDTTLIDFASDVRAPTPTAAAEMAVPVRLDLLAQVNDDSVRLIRSVRRLMDERRTQLKGCIRGLPNLGAIVEQKHQDLDQFADRHKFGPQRLLDAKRADLRATDVGLKLGYFKRDLTRFTEELADRHVRIGRGWERFLQDLGARGDNLSLRLDSVSPARVLERGYSIIWDASNNPVTSAKPVRIGDVLRIEFQDADIPAVVGRPGATRKMPVAKTWSVKSGKNAKQGKLL